MADVLKYGIGVPPGKVATTPEEAEKVAKELSMRWRRMKCQWTRNADTEQRRMTWS